MAWKPLLHFSFENHAALDETGHGYHGRVELPGPDRWKDTPAEGIATAVAFDHPESKIVVAPRPAFGAWRGLRVRAYFRAEAAQGRLNLVEGDGAFALFVEPGGVLRGTINDGSAEWWGVSSSSDRVRTARWHFAELLYDTGQVLALSLDGQLLGVRTTAGLPVRPVGGAGIRIGYWPGGDSRYTFRGLMGPVWIDTLDEREPIVGIVNKALCSGSNGTSRLEALRAVFDAELTAPEKQAVKTFGTTVTAAVRRLAAVVVGQAADPTATLDQMTALADELGSLTAAHEAAGTDAFQDPVLAVCVNKLYAAACRNNPAAAGAFVVEALQILARLPLTPERWGEITRRHPELCNTGVPPVDLSGGSPGGDGGWVDDLIDRLCRGRKPTPGGGDPGRPCGCEEPHAPAGSPECGVHIHVHCHREEGGTR